jgi:RNA polymerase sigma factor (sigma-70 family)
VDARGGDTREIELWSRAQANDSSAFGAIFDLHRDRVFGQALRLVRHPHDAEDITALVFLELWRKRGQVEPSGGTIVGWLLVTTNFVVRNFERTARRHRDAMARLPRPEAAADHASAVQWGLDSRPARAAIRSAFLRLSARDQDILTLCVLEELSEAQASSALGIARGTVKSRLSRAKGRLARLVQGDGTPILREGLTNER